MDRADNRVLGAPALADATSGGDGLIAGPRSLAAARARRPLPASVITYSAALSPHLAATGDRRRLTVRAGVFGYAGC